MAIYSGPDGKDYDCVQLAEGEVFPSGSAAQKGEWIVRPLLPVTAMGDAVHKFVLGAGKICPAEDFKLFRQKYPKPVDGERKDPPKPTTERSTA